MYYFTLIKAEWCGHCQDFIHNSLNQILEYIKQHKDFIQFAVLDADKDNKIIEKLNYCQERGLKAHEKNSIVNEENLESLNPIILSRILLVS